MLFMTSGEQFTIPILCLHGNLSIRDQSAISFRLDCIDWVPQILLHQLDPKDFVMYVCNQLTHHHNNDSSLIDLAEFC